MRELHYLDGSLIVDDDVCLAVFTYAVALAKAGSADLITIPILWEDQRRSANLVLGPASQLFCTPTHHDQDEVDLSDAELVQELGRRISRLGPRTAVAVPGAMSGSVLQIDDL